MGTVRIEVDPYQKEIAERFARQADVFIQGYSKSVVGGNWDGPEKLYSDHGRTIKAILRGMDDSELGRLAACAKSTDGEDGKSTWLGLLGEKWPDSRKSGRELLIDLASVAVAAGILSLVK